MKKYYLVVTSVLIIFNCTMPPVNMVPNLGYYYNPKDRGFLFSKTQLIVSANTSYYQTKIYYSRGQSFQRGRFLQNQSLQLELYHPISVGMVIPTSISCYSIYPYVKYKMIKCDIKYITSVNPFLAIAPHSYHFREIPFSTGVNVAKINRKSGNAAGISLIFANSYIEYTDDDEYNYTHRTFYVNNKELIVGLAFQKGMYFINFNPSIIVHYDSRAGEFTGPLESRYMPVRFTYPNRFAISAIIGIDFSMISKHY